LKTARSTGLDKCPTPGLYFLNVGASQNVIVDDVKDYVSRLQRRNGIKPKKIHAAKIADYLKVWDLREGWIDGRYDTPRELKFIALSKWLKLPKSTVVNHYRKAFEFITGNAFTAESWWRLMGVLKFSALFGNDARAFETGSRHQRRTRIPHLKRKANEQRKTTTTAANLAANRDGTDPLETVAKGPIPPPGADFHMDMDDLIAKGWDDEKIAKELDISATAAAYYRDRKYEFVEYWM